MWGETDGLPGGSLGDVDNVKEKDCRNDKIIHKLKNWPETGNIAVEDKKKLIFPSMCFLDAKCCKKYSKIFYSWYFSIFFQYFATLFHLDWPAHSINWATEVCSDEQQPGEHQEVVQTGEEEELFEVDREEDAEDKHPGDGDGEEGAETFRWGWEVSKATGRQLLSEWTEASLSPPTYSPENILIILIFIVIIIVFIAIIVIIGVYNDLRF